MEFSWVTTGQYIGAVNILLKQNESSTFSTTAINLEKNIENIGQLSVFISSSHGIEPHVKYNLLIESESPSAQGMYKETIVFLPRKPKPYTKFLAPIASTVVDRSEKIKLQWETNIFTSQNYRWWKNH